MRGLRHLVGDMISAPRMPSMFEPDAFTLGEDGTGTPGSVVFRPEMFEPIQYAPQTDQVSSVPLLMVPPVINKFYITDIAPGRSMSEYFVPCWRNDRARRERSSMTTYLEAPADLIDLVGQRVGDNRLDEVTQQQVNLLADATDDHQWIHTDPQRAARSPFKGTIAHGYLALSLAPVVISEGLQIRAVTSALNRPQPGAVPGAGAREQRHGRVIRPGGLG